MSCICAVEEQLSDLLDTTFENYGRAVFFEDEDTENVLGSILCDLLTAEETLSNYLDKPEDYLDEPEDAPEPPVKDYIDTEAYDNNGEPI